MDTKQRKAIQQEADYIKLLALKIYNAAYSDLESKQSGTITNLAPELRKSATRVARLTKYGWEDVV